VLLINFLGNNTDIVDQRIISLSKGIGHHNTIVYP